MSNFQYNNDYNIHLTNSAKMSLNNQQILMRVIYLCNMKAPPTDKRRNTSGSQKTRLKIIGTSIE